MKSFFKQFWQLVLHDPHLVLAAGIAGYYVCLHLLDKEVPQQGAFILVMMMVLFLVINELRRSYERLTEEDRLETCSATMARVAEAFFDKRVALRARPSKPEDYAYLWGGYTGTYNVYNPSYHVEEGAGKAKVIQIMAERYMNPKFEQARYVFLTGDQDGKADLMKFRGLMAGVKTAYPDVVAKIEVKELRKEPANSAAEMYLGTRDRLPTAILELRDPALGPSHGKPHYYLIINDEGIIDQYLQKHFNEAWDSADAVRVDIFAEEPAAEEGATLP
jgi:hypothetical protein